MKVVSGKIMEATRAELLDYYLTRDWDAVMPFAEFLRRCEENGTKITDKKGRRREVNVNMDVSEKERNAIMAMRRVEDLREGNVIVGDAILEDGSLTVTRYIGGHHPQYAVYDGSQMICLCVYKRGAMALVEYINKMKGMVK